MSCFWSLSHPFSRSEQAFFKSCFSSLPAPEIKHLAVEADLQVECILQKSPQTLFPHRKQGVKEVTWTMGKLPLKSHMNPTERLKSIQFEAHHHLGRCSILLTSYVQNYSIPFMNNLELETCSCSLSFSLSRLLSQKLK